MSERSLRVITDEFDDLVPRELARRGNRAPEVAPLPQGESALSLLERDMETVTYKCNPWIPEGLNILAGRPKLGKSTMLRQKASAVACGGELWGEQCTKSGVLLLWLEEGPRLARAKFEAAGFSREALANITLYFDWPRGADGVLQLHQVLDARPEIGYVGIDSLTRFRTAPDARTPAFQADYEAVSGVHTVAKGRPGLAIDLVHHTRKAKGEDPLDDISGTYGLTAACDSYHVMRHHEDGAVLHVGGRLWDRDVSQYQLRRDNQRWELSGEFTGLSQALMDTREYLRKNSGAGPSEAGRFWGISKQSAQSRLDALVQKGYATSKHGSYYIT